jgi:hypothetical protein
LLLLPLLQLPLLLPYRAFQEAIEYGQFALRPFAVLQLSRPGADGRCMKPFLFPDNAGPVALHESYTTRMLVSSNLFTSSTIY